MRIIFVVVSALLASLFLPISVSSESTPWMFWHYDHDDNFVMMPYDMWLGISHVVWCESKDDPDRIGRAGELGRLQIHPIHFDRMLSWELDPWSEHDRNLYGVYLYTRSGWAPWVACQP